jgi:malonyl-CoA O-methyltransferase
MPPPAPEAYALDRKAIRKSFDAASRRYDGAAALQTEIRDQLLERLQLVRLAPAVVLDLGAGTAHASRALKRLYPRAQVIALDVAFGMLREARRQRGLLHRFHRVCADAFRLPLGDGSVDLIYSNLMLQWCDEPDRVFAEVHRVLKPHGLFTFTSFGPDTLQELRRAWAAVDAHTHVNHFIDMHDLGDALVRARLAEPVMDMERYTLTYPEAMGLLRDLKAIGAHNVTSGRPRGLTGKKSLGEMQEAYEAFRRDGVLPATYEVVFGQAWRGEDVGSLTGRPAEVHISPAAIGRRGPPRT